MSLAKDVEFYEVIKSNFESKKDDDKMGLQKKHILNKKDQEMPLEKVDESF